MLILSHDSNLYIANGSYQKVKNTVIDFLSKFSRDACQYANQNRYKDWLIHTFSGSWSRLLT
uniref:Uncharacterized protein n=1 Tax=Arundo donax TaxID=35708 RepID=A0A0A8YDD5_ARUDO